MSSNKNIWKDIKLPSIGNQFEINAPDMGTIALLKDLLLKKTGYISYYNKDAAISNVDENGQIVDRPKFFHELLLNKKGRLIYKYIDGLKINNIYLFDHGIVHLNMNNFWAEIIILSNDEFFVQNIKEYIEPIFSKEEPTGIMYAIMRQGMSLTLTSLGNTGISLIKENYTNKVITDYQYMIDDLKSKNPSGRLSIIRGPAGSGKTHLVRDIVLSAPKGLHVLINPKIVTELDGPELLPLLISNKYKNGPIILYLEDADRCLVSRDKNNMNSIQSLLNLGDGILGSMLDIRIIATTNAQELQIEEALVRPGRLSKMIDVELLDPKTAINIFNRLCPGSYKPKKLNENISLAEVYLLARQSGWIPADDKSLEEGESDNQDFFDD